MSPKNDYEEGDDSNKYSKFEINVGEYVAKRIRVFSKHTNLDPVRQVQSLDWTDISSDRPLLGKGAFSNVYRVHIPRSLITTPEGQSGEDNNDDDNHHVPMEYYALKRLNATTSQRDKKFKVGASDLALEAKLLERLDHPNIIQLHAVKSGNLEDCINNRDYFLVMDYLVQTLDDRILQWQRESCLWRKPLLKSIAIKRLIHRIEQTAMGLVQAMEYLHSKVRTFWGDHSRFKIYFRTIGNGIHLNCCTKAMHIT
jgi:serine/threonine protein kinase